MPLITCEAVLTEAAYPLRRPEPLLQMLVDGDLVAEQAPELLRWLAKYAGLDPGLADACVVRLSEVTPRAEVLTTDRRDFSIIRLKRNRALRLIPDTQ